MGAISKKQMTVGELIKQLQNINDDEKIVNVLNTKGELTSDISLFDEKWVVILDGGDPLSY